MFSLKDDLIWMEGFTSEEVVDIVDSYLSSDDLCWIIYHALNDNDIEIPDNIREHYELHCK